MPKTRQRWPLVSAALRPMLAMTPLRSTTALWIAVLLSIYVLAYYI